MTTFQLRVSWTDMSIDHTRIMQILMNEGVKSTVTSGCSVCKDTPSSEPQLERSVIVDLYASDKEQITNVLWPAFRDALGLTCIHVYEWATGFRGCIHEFGDESRCPHTKEKAPDPSKVPRTILMSLLL